MLATKVSNHQTYNLSDLYSTLKIPVYSEFLHSTGSYENAILLNQIFYSNKEKLTINDIKRFSLSDLTNQTLRKKLDTLISKGFIKKRKVGMYGRYYYSIANEVYPSDNEIVALVEGLDLKDNHCYLTAAILNKFRQFALSDVTDIRISANELKQILQTEKSDSLVRLILRRLTKQGYLQEALEGGVYRYIINVQRFLNVFNPDELIKQSKELTDIFKHYMLMQGHDVTSKKLNGWEQSFKRILSDGLNYSSVRHILAYIGLNSSHEHIKITTPVGIRHKFDELLLKSERLSKRKAQKYVYKLLNKLITPKKHQEPIQDNIISDNELWQKAYDFATKKIATLQRWFYSSSAGVSDVCFDDYFNEAVIIAFNRFKKSKDNNYDVSDIHFSLKEFMLKHRHIDPYIKDGNNIVQFHYHDLSEINVAQKYDDIEKDNIEAKNLIFELLGNLDARSREVLELYYGFDGRSYTLEEIAYELGFKSKGYMSKILKAAMDKLKLYAANIDDPPI